MPPTEITSERHALRDSAHKVFDRLWDGSFKYHKHSGEKRRAVSRDLAYRWLAHQLGVDANHCHFSTLGQERLIRAIRLCRKTTPHTIACWARTQRAAEALTQGGSR